MTVSILGCGWFGKNLALSLVSKEIRVKGSVTSAAGFDQLSAIGVIPYAVKFNPDRDNFDPDFFRCDLLVISIPPKFKSGETEGYLHKIQRVINAALKYQVDKIIYISSTGVYGDHNSVVNESDDPQPDTSGGKILEQAEKLFQNEKRVATAIIRFAGLVGPGRHPGRFFAGKNDIPNGLAPVNLIHLDDCVGIALAIVDKNVFGSVINAVSANHPSKVDFYTDAALQAGLTAPEFIEELNTWKIVESTRLTPILTYEFKIPAWKDVKFN